jgi:hypothetical protein
VLSVYGVQFAPDQQRAASELVRVTRPRGRIVLASPPPYGWSGDFFAVHGRYNPPAPGLASPLRWGTDEGLGELFGDACARRQRSRDRRCSTGTRPSTRWRCSRRWFGPTIRAAEALDDEGRRALRADLEEVFLRYDRSTDDTAVVENTYLLTIVTIGP